MRRQWEHFWDSLSFVIEGDKNNYLITKKQIRFDKWELLSSRGQRSKSCWTKNFQLDFFFLPASVRSSKLSQANFTSTDAILPACAAADSGFDLVRSCQHGRLRPSCSPPGGFLTPPGSESSLTAGARRGCASHDSGPIGSPAKPAKWHAALH